MGAGRSVVASTRVSQEDMAYLRAEAARRGVFVSDLIWRLVVPVVRNQVRVRLATQEDDAEGDQ